MNKKMVLFKLPAIFVKAGFIFLPEHFNRIYGSFELDNIKTKKMLNFSSPYTSEEGLQKMIISFENK
jgi:hypothetical protein